MIIVVDKLNCCGCSSCVQSCPKKCINFDEDEQGFRYPQVNLSLCVECGLCEKVCPIIDYTDHRDPLKVYAGINPNEEVRMKSSSGGIFSMLGEAIIAGGGVVFGARFDDNWEVVHDYTETVDGLEVFRGSKYLQSRISNTYIKVQTFLAEGRKVLFSGTGCQIAGLKKFLRRDYPNLLAVEIVCHSVPSPLLWRKYLREICGDNVISHINFRDKASGWSHYSYKMIIDHAIGTYSESASGDYMKGMTTNLTTRPSCNQCQFRLGKSGADIILGDCWGVWDVLPNIDDNKGVSIVMVASVKGDDITKSLGFKYWDVRIEEMRKYNAGISELQKTNTEHDKFFIEIQKNESVVATLKSFLPTLKQSHGIKKILNYFRLKILS